MEILLHTPLDNQIVSLLLVQGEQKISDIYHSLSDAENPVTIQAVYKRIRHLIKTGVVLKNKHLITISSEWSQSIVTLLSSFSSLPILKPGESITYTFKGLSALDAYWKHVMLPLEKGFVGYPIFFYNPHEIWINLLDRQQSEEVYLQQFIKNQRYCFYLLGKQSRLNEKFRQKYSSNYLQISISPRSFSDRDYIAIVSDYIITTRLPSKLTKAIDDIYMHNKENNGEALLNDKSLIKLKIERNIQKARKLRKNIAKDFYIPKELKAKYNLY